MTDWFDTCVVGEVMPDDVAMVYSPYLFTCPAVTMIYPVPDLRSGVPRIYKCSRVVRHTGQHVTLQRYGDTANEPNTVAAVWSNERRETRPQDDPPGTVRRITTGANRGEIVVKTTMPECPWVFPYWSIATGHDYPGGNYVLNGVDDWRLAGSSEVVTQLPPPPEERT